jgi:hypothetical protein
MHLPGRKRNELACLNQLAAVDQLSGLRDVSERLNPHHRVRPVGASKDVRDLRNDRVITAMLPPPFVFVPSLISLVSDANDRILE